MRIVLNIDDELLAKAMKATGIKETSTLVMRGLEALVVIYNLKQLARLGGTEKGLKLIPRRRTLQEIKC